MENEALIYSYCFVGGALLVLVLLGLTAAAKMPGLHNYSKRFFIASFSILALSITSFFVDLIVYENPDLILLEQIASFFETVMPSLLMPFLSVYILRCSHDNRHRSALIFIVIGCLVALVILL